ncbi:MAG: hypothetical protein NVS3B14_04970 [Ktedonobacteraceae bacterium]
MTFPPSRFTAGTGIPVRCGRSAFSGGFRPGAGKKVCFLTQCEVMMEGASLLSQPEGIQIEQIQITEAKLAPDEC